MADFKNNKAAADELLVKARQVAKGKTLAEAGIDSSWMVAYGQVAQRVDTDRRYGLTRYPYEPGPAISAFVGGFFDNRDWSLRHNLAGHASMRAVMEYEAKYVNASGYWCAFNQVAIELRDEKLSKDEVADGVKFDVWAIIAVQYSLRVLGLRSEFYRMAAIDPVHAKMVLPALERRGDAPASDDLEEPLKQLENNMVTQLLKAVANLSASNATKKTNGGGGAAGGG